jgi:HEAT repeat protein
MFFFKPNVKKMEEKRNVKGLIKALEHKDPNVRSEAAKALGRIGDERAVEPLIQALRDKYGSVREAAAEALVKIGAPAVEPLITALRDEEWYVRRAAAEALDELGWKPGQDEGAAWYWMVKRDWEKCVALGAIAVEPLISALRDEDDDVREAAAEALGELGDSRAVKPLISALRDDRYWRVRKAAAEALGEIGDERALEELERMAKYGISNIKVLLDPDERRRTLVTYPYGFIPARDEELLWQYVGLARNKLVCEAARRAIAKIRKVAYKPSGEMLETLARHASERLVQGLPIDPKWKHDLLLALSCENLVARRWAATALKGFNFPDVCDALEKALSDEDAIVRAEACKSLYHLKGDAALPVLERMLANETSDYVRQSIEDLIGPNVAVDHLPEHQREIVRNALAALDNSTALSFAVFETPNGTYEPGGKEVDELLDSVAAMGSTGIEVLLKRFFYGIYIDEQGISLKNWGDDAWAEFLRKARIAVALGRARALDVASTLARVVGTYSDVGQFNEIVRPAVARALRDMNAFDILTKEVSKLIDELRKDPDDRRNVVAGLLLELSKVVKGTVAELCIDSLKNHRDPNVRAYVALVLGEMRTSDGVDALIHGLHDNDLWVRRNCASALGKIADTRALQPVSQCVTDQDWGVRMNAATALGKIGGAGAVESLQAFLKDSDERVRTAAAKAIEKLGAT